MGTTKCLTDKNASVSAEPRHLVLSLTHWSGSRSNRPETHHPSTINSHVIPFTAFCADDLPLEQLPLGLLFSPILFSVLIISLCLFMTSMKNESKRAYLLHYAQKWRAALDCGKFLNQTRPFSLKEISHLLLLKVVLTGLSCSILSLLILIE